MKRHKTAIEEHIMELKDLLKDVLTQDTGTPGRIYICIR